MVARIVLDVIRRRWKVLAFAVFQIYLIGRIPWEFWPASDPMAWLLCFAALLTTAPGVMLESRELYQLPVPRRTWWIARWWLATAGVVVLAQLALALARWSARSEWPETEWLMLSSTIAFLYCGCVMALAGTRAGRQADKPLAIEPAPGRAAVRPPVRPAIVWWVILKAFAQVLVPALVALAAPVVIPFFISPYLPHSYSEIDTLSLGVMLAMAGCAVWGYLYRPGIDARPSQRAMRPVADRRRDRPEAPAHAATAARARFEDRLTGLRLPLWRAGRKYLIAYSVILAAGVAWWWVASFYQAVPPLSAVLSRVDMLPFASPSPRVTEPITIGILMIVTSLLETGFAGNVRPLRTLPLSATQLGCVPVALGLLSAAMLWVVLLVLHGLVLGTLPVTLRVDLFVAFAALSALGHVLRVILPGQLPARTSLGVMGPLGIVWLAVGYRGAFPADVVQPAMLLGGLLVLAGSFALMRRAIARSSRVYRIPAGVGAPGL